MAAPEASGDSGPAEIAQNGSLTLAADTQLPAPVIGRDEGKTRDEVELPSNVEDAPARDRDGEPPEALPEPQ